MPCPPCEAPRHARQAQRRKSDRLSLVPLRATKNRGAGKSEQISWRRPRSEQFHPPRAEESSAKRLAHSNVCNGSKADTTVMAALGGEQTLAHGTNRGIVTLRLYSGLSSRPAIKLARERRRATSAAAIGVSKAMAHSLPSDHTTSPRAWMVPALNCRS